MNWSIAVVVIITFVYPHKINYLFFIYIPCLLLDRLTDACLGEPYTCPDGISVSFWLQFISGSVILQTGRVGFYIYVENGNFFITFRNLTHAWKIERGCMPMGVFHVTATWTSTSGLSYYENGNVVASTMSPEKVDTALRGQNVAVGFEETSSGKRFSSLVIDDLVIWKRLMLPSEVQNIYSHGKERLFFPASVLAALLCTHQLAYLHTNLNI